MRRLFLFVSFLLLIGGLLALWRFRFERIPGTPALTLSDLRGANPDLPPGAAWEGSAEDPVLRLSVGPGQPRVGVRMELPGFPAMDCLLIRFQMSASNLQLGAQKWDDGRTLIQWRSPDGGGGQEIDAVCSLRENDASGDVSLVVRSSSGSAIPVLRAEHLGVGGEFEVSKLEMIPVKERAVWRFGRWVLLAACFAWLWALMAGARGCPAWKRILAVCIWLGMALIFAIPGPWQTLRPLVLGFEIGTPSVAEQAGDGKAGVVSAPPAQPSLADSSRGSVVQEKIPNQGGWIIQTKLRLAMARPLLHAMLLFAPALAFCFLVGRKMALVLAIALAVLIEAAQTAFGYGFDWVDWFDLTTNAAGIALAMWVYVRIQRWHVRKMEKSLPA
jgi:hypothetical protein